jgi:urease accessory protein
VAERSGAGTRCTTLRSEPPLTLRETPDGLHVVGSAAGPVGGDDTSLDVEVANAAALTVRTVAAQLLFPGANGRPSRAVTRLRLGVDATLTWLPEPVVAVRGADHRGETTIVMATGASLVWRDVAVLGRHDEDSGSVRQRLRVERDGQPLVCTDVMLGPAWPHASGPAGTAGSRVVMTLLLVGAAATAVPSLEELTGVRAGALELAVDALLVPAHTDSVSRLAPLLSALGAA